MENKSAIEPVPVVACGRIRNLSESREGGEEKKQNEQT
jgi:hypothetical protein